MIQCQKCGQTNAAGSNFCRACGNNFATAPPSKRRRKLRIRGAPAVFVENRRIAGGQTRSAQNRTNQSRSAARQSDFKRKREFRAASAARLSTASISRSKLSLSAMRQRRFADCRAQSFYGGLDCFLGFIDFYVDFLLDRFVDERRRARLSGLPGENCLNE
jgi:hypothetical protein